MVREKFHDKLEGLKEKVSKMGKKVYEYVKICSEALFTNNNKLAERVSKKTDFWNEIEEDIEKECIRVIALHQPMASDLRALFVYIKIVTDFDRMGRLSGHIADVVLNHKSLQIHSDLKEMFDKVEEMIDVVIDAFVNDNIPLVDKLTEKDDRIDDLFEKIFNEIIGSMKDTCSHISTQSDMLFVARWLERLGDHACRIGERIIYMLTGKRKKVT